MSTDKGNQSVFYRVHPRVASTYNAPMKQLPEALPEDPMDLVTEWVADARADAGFPNPDAMALATVDADGRPANRIVLCKQIVSEPGYIVFYTNYESAKAEQLGANAAAAAVFHWDHLDRQIRLEGHTVRSPAAESDAYFASRNRGSQVGAWASAQSSTLEERAQLLLALQAIELRFPHGETVPRPPHWGGYRIWLTAVEFWARGKARLHDRGRWERELGEPLAEGDYVPGPWVSRRLQP